MGDQLGEVVPLETAQAWDSARRVREPIAWTRPGVWFVFTPRISLPWRPR
jgi:hypothetical protein